LLEHDILHFFYLGVQLGGFGECRLGFGWLSVFISHYFVCHSFNLKMSL